MGEAIAGALRHWQYQDMGETTSTHHPLTTPPWTIAISRQAGANGSAVACAVGQRLGWPVYDRELVEKIAQEAGLRGQLVESVDERRISWLEECWQGFTSQPSFSQLAYVRRLVRVLSALAAHGACVIVGRGAAQVLPQTTTLRVRLVGPEDAREAVIRNRLGLGAKEARRHVKEIDEQRTRFVRDYFHIAPDDPTDYDLWLNSCRLSVADCADLIVTALERLKASTGGGKRREPVVACQA
jgi:cytidylate kinase